jgi:hypothetical protein
MKSNGRVLPGRTRDKVPDSARVQADDKYVNVELAERTPDRSLIVMYEGMSLGVIMHVSQK